jgi:poly(hydroxyalkanoate) depolymerase family esterase
MPRSILSRRPYASGLPLLALALVACSGGASPAGSTPEPVDTVSLATTAIAQVSGFGSNPGNLLMYAYTPSAMPAKAPLVLALHGCTETASDYTSAGWNALADTYKFYVLYPQQQTQNNTEGCFNWFGNTAGSTTDITRGQGEGESIIQMIDHLESMYSIDNKRVYATGFSAGAAYAVAMLAMYPDVFAAGASFSGLPFGCATSLSTAETCMAAPPTKTAAQWGMLAQAGFPGYAGPWPRLSVWQGSSDTTVSTQNLTDLVAQWTDLTGASSMPSTTNTVGGFPHNEYSSGAGVTVESYSITSMSHAVAIDAPNGCGTAGTYYVDEGVCAVDRVAKFFGLEGSQGSSSGSGSGGGSGGGSGSGSGSGGGSGGGGGSGSGGTGSSSGSAAPIGDGGTGANGAAPAAAPAAPLPGCSVSAPGRDGLDTGWMLAGLALGLLATTRATRRNVR